MSRRGRRTDFSRLERLKRMLDMERNRASDRYLKSSSTYREYPLPDRPYNDWLMPEVKWLSRPHPCPDIEDRIREVRSTQEVSP